MIFLFLKNLTTRTHTKYWKVKNCKFKLTSNISNVHVTFYLLVI